MEITNLLFLLANLAVLGLNLKLYTEVLKDKSQDNRQRQSRHSFTEQSMTNIGATGSTHAGASRPDAQMESSARHKASGFEGERLEPAHVCLHRPLGPRGVPQCVYCGAPPQGEAIDAGDPVSVLDIDAEKLRGK